MLRDDRDQRHAVAPAEGAYTWPTLVTAFFPLTMHQPNQTPMQEAAEVLRNLPEDSSLKDIQYHHYVLEKIRKGREDIAGGRAYTHEDAKQRLSRWLAG